MQIWVSAWVRKTATSNAGNAERESRSADQQQSFTTQDNTHTHNTNPTGVRRTSLTVLGHLILNDMMKVKGNIARIALRLVDEQEEVRAAVLC